MRAGGLGLGVGRARGRIAGGFSVNWRAGFEGGVIPPETATSTVLADLVPNSSMGTVTFSEIADPSALFTVTGTTLVLSAVISPSSTATVTIRGTGTLKTVDRVVTVTSTPALAAPANTAVPTISGAAVQGQTLSASTGTWTGYPSPTFAYQWKADGSNISGATASTYLLTGSEVGKVITVTVTATNTSGSASAASAATGTVVGGAPAASDQLILVAGQSNGEGPIGTFPGSIDSARVKIWNGSAFVGYVPGSTSNPIPGGFATTCWGPEAGYAHKWLIDHPTGTLYIVKAALGGTSVASWLDGQTNFDFAEGWVNAAKAALGGSLNVSAELWMQGEAEATGSGSGTYETNLTTHISQVRSLIGSAATKVAIGRIQVLSAVNRDVVRAAQNAVAYADPLAYLIDTDDLATQEGTHYTTAGEFTLGQRMYDAIATGATIEFNPSTPDTTVPTITSASSFSVAENSTAVATLTANETVTWSIVGGADAAKFTINSSTGALAFASAPDYETPLDGGTNNVYDVTVRATDTAGNTTDQAIAVTVTDVAEGAATTTFDPANKGASVTLTNGNLTANGNSAARGVARSLASHSTGKYYFEAIIQNNAAGGLYNIGAVTAAHVLSGIPIGGSGSEAEGIALIDGGFWASLLPGAGESAPVSENGVPMAVCIDLDNNKYWVKKLSGNWNNNASSDPATNTGGATFAGVAGRPLFAAVSIWTTGNQIDVNFGATAYAMTPPAGFGNW